jgi:hypothetical protein
MSASPRRAATAVAIIRMARSERVRTSRGAPAWADALIPAASGRREAPCLWAPRTTTTRYTSAMPHWAMTVPQAEPATPRSAP